MWTPVRVRNPKKTDNYLVTTVVLEGGQKCFEVKTALWIKTNESWIVHEVDACIPGEVIAWDVLPGPYKESDSAGELE